MWGTLATIGGVAMAVFTILKTIADLNVPQDQKAILLRMGAIVRDRRKQPPEGLLPDSIWVEHGMFTGYARIYSGCFIKRVPFIYKAKAMNVWERPIYSDPIEMKFADNMQYHVRTFLNVTIPREGLFGCLFLWFSDFDGQIRAAMQATVLAYAQQTAEPVHPDIMATVIQDMLQARLDDRPYMNVQITRLQFVEYGDTPITLWTHTEERRVRNRFFAARSLKTTYPAETGLIQAVASGGSSSVSPGMPWTDIPGVRQAEALDGDGLNAA